MFVFFFFLFFSCVNGILIPSETEGVYAIETRQTVTLSIGTPPRPLKFILDYSTGKVHTDYNLATFSSSYLETMTGSSDVLHIAGESIRFNIVPNAGRSAALGCNDCDGGVLGLGPMSNIWLYRHDGTFTVGSISVGEGIPSYERIALANNLGFFDCMPVFDELCAAKGTVMGYPNLTIIIGANTEKTLLPVILYDKYTDGLNVMDNTDPDDWGPIHFVFPVSDPNKRDNEWRLRAQDIVADSRKGGVELLLAGSGSPDTVILSRSAWHSMMFRRDFLGRKAQVVHYESARRLSLYNAIGFIVVSLCYFYWTLEPAGIWSFRLKNGFVIFATDGISISFSVATIIVSATSQTLWSYPEMGAFVIFTSVMLICWILYGDMVYIFHYRDMFGSVKVYLKQTKPITISQRIYTLGLTPADKSAARKELENARIMGTFHPRTWVVLTISRQALVIITLLLLAFETRNETLGYLSTTALGLLLIFTVLVYGFVAILMPFKRVTFAWLLFYISVAYLVDIYIFAPFLERFMQVSDVYLPFIRACIYALLVILALDVANKRVKIEEVLRRKMLQTFPQ